MNDTIDINMNPIEPTQLSSATKRAFKLVEFDKDEQLLLEVRKHWFGLFGIYTIGAFILISLSVAALWMAAIDVEQDFGIGTNISTLQLFTIFVCMLTATLTIGGTAIGAYLYTTNVIFVTSDKITQVLYTSLFNRKISQLGVGDVQDVTVVQKGIFAHFFKYGTIIVETSGEQQNYHFSFVPNPYEVAKVIIRSREVNLQRFGN